MWMGGSSTGWLPCGELDRGQQYDWPAAFHADEQRGIVCLLVGCLASSARLPRSLLQPLLSVWLMLKYPEIAD